MHLEFTLKNEELRKYHLVTKQLIKAVAPKGRLHVDPKKGKIIVENFSVEKIDVIMNLIEENFEHYTVDLNGEKKFKLMNDEKILRQKKEDIQKEFENPKSIGSKVRKSIFERKVFTLTDLREEFPDVNFATIRSYVNDLKNDGLLLEISRGKYVLK